MSRGDDSNAQLVQMLKAIPLFAHLSDRELKAMARMAKTEKFEPGDVICEEGHTGVGLHVVEEGEVEVKVGGTSRRQMGSGAFFGEVALLDGGPRSATVIAATPATTLSLSAWDFKGLLEKHPEIATKMLPELGRRLRENDTSITK